MDAKAPVLTDETLLEPLRKERAFFESTHLHQLFSSDSNRFQRFSTQCADLFIDFSKNRIRDNTISCLCQLATKANLAKARQKLISGEKLNTTENRAALHTALRAPYENRPETVKDQIEEAQQLIFRFSDQINNGLWLGYSGKPIESVVNIGIGGSDLGPAMTVNALKAYQQNPRLDFYFVSNVDPSNIRSVLEKCNPETTLFIIASKTFTTLETLSNASTARQWFLNSANDAEHIKQHFVAISTNTEKVKAFGIDKSHMFPMWDWVGGRYSIWSAIGLPLCIAIGKAQFQSFLNGAYQVDQHFLNTPLDKNGPVILALLSIWYSEFFNTQSHGILCYDYYLDKFPDYLQQLDMESNGKGITISGEPVTYKTGVPVWGNTGTNSQHSFHQLFHQGTIEVPVDFIVGANSCNPAGNQQQQLFANCLAQSQALMQGKTESQVREELKDSGLGPEEIDSLAPHKIIPGNKPSTTIVYPKLTPSVLGQLIALYEHKIFTQSVIWNINPFDQWGVELGKQLSQSITQAVCNGKNEGFDSSTEGLIKLYKSLSS